jgi:site-specific recombinase XerD
MVNQQLDKAASRIELDRLIEEFLEHLEVERNVSPLTLRNYKHYLTRFSTWFKANFRWQSTASLDLDKIKKFRVFLARFKGPNNKTLALITQSYHVIALRAWLRWLIKNDYKAISPEKIDLPKAKSASLKFLNAEQVERFLAQPNLKTKKSLRDKAVLEVLFSTGLRVSELVSLDREKVNLKTREFGVVGKGGRARVVFLSSRAVHFIDLYLQERKDNFRPLFIRSTSVKKQSTDGEKLRLTARTIQRIVRYYSKKAALPVSISPHGIRHSFATDLLVAGADIRSVQEMLGHKNIATTQIYTHVTNKQLRHVHEAFHGKGK